MRENSWLPEQKPYWADPTDSAMANTPMSVGQACRNQGAAALGCPACRCGATSLPTSQGCSESISPAYSQRDFWDPGKEARGLKNEGAVLGPWPCKLPTLQFCSTG